MVSPKELRIDNKLCRLNQQNILTVASIDKAGDIYFEGLDEHHFDLTENQGIEGIILTPKILEKCGFVKGFDECWSPKSGFLIKEITDGYSLLGYSGKSKEVKYLHQLQNLFHSLTGEELEIKL